MAVLTLYFLWQWWHHQSQCWIESQAASVYQQCMHPRVSPLCTYHNVSFLEGGPYQLRFSKDSTCPMLMVLLVRTPIHPSLKYKVLPFWSIIQGVFVLTRLYARSQIYKINSINGWEVSQVIKCLPGKHEDWSSIPQKPPFFFLICNSTSRKAETNGSMRPSGQPALTSWWVSGQWVTLSQNRLMLWGTKDTRSCLQTFTDA